MGCKSARSNKGFATLDCYTLTFKIYGSLRKRRYRRARGSCTPVLLASPLLLLPFSRRLSASRSSGSNSCCVVGLSGWMY